MSPHHPGWTPAGSVAPVPRKPLRFRGTWPHIRSLLKPRKGLLALGLLLMAVNRVAGLVLPASTKYLIDRVLLHRQLGLLSLIISAVLLATAVQGGTSYALTQLLSKEAQRLINELRRQVQQHVSRLPLAFYDANNTGSLVARIMSDVEGVRNLVGTGLVQFVGGIITSLIALVYLLHVSVAMTLVALGFVAAFVLFTRTAFKTIRPIFRERRKINAEVTGRLTESLGGIRVVKSYHAEARESAVFAAGLQRLLLNVFRSLTATSLLDLSSKVMMGVVGATVMLMGAHRVLAGTMTLGELVTFNLFLAYLVAPMIEVVNIGTQLSEAIAGLERTHELLQLAPEDQDARRTHELAGLAGAIEFDHVHFAYDEGEEVLHGISFAAPAGSVTALVGPSGSGKSTIIGLVAGFYTPTDGRILVDGVDLASLTFGSYRSRLGVVLQESFLFDGTIRENVAFSRPQATAEEFLNACRIARVDEFAERFPAGYDTIIGERGVKLSGGQRQRLSIARAILADPAILILDEATSSLDSESEALIQHGLQYLMRGRTTFVIAHRLSTIRAADQILVVEDGAIAERGRHAELLQAGGRYYELYTRQQGVEANRFLAPGEGDHLEPQAAPAVPGRGEGEPGLGIRFVD